MSSLPPLFLTAAIDVRGVPQVQLADSRVREAQYLAAFHYYCHSLPGHPIVWCENTGCDLDRIRFAARGFANVEIHQRQQTPAESERGKGHSELALLDFALRSSRTLSNAHKILKVTGRYVVSNIASVVRAVGQLSGVDVVVDLRRYLTFSDSRVFAFSPRFAESFLLPLSPHVDDQRGVFVEHAIARAAHSALACGLAWRPMPVEPIIEGVSGTDGRAYRTSAVRVAVRRTLRYANRVLLSR